MSALPVLRTILCMSLCLFLLAIPSSRAAAAGSDIAKRLTPSPTLRGQFTQSKRLAGFKNPLNSRGEFVYDAGRGMVWLTRAPFESTLVLSGGKLQARDSNGRLRSIGASSASATTETANRIMMSLLAGDLRALGEQFVMKEAIFPDGTWQLVLLPRSGALKQAFARILLRGDKHVRSVVLSEARGNQTSLDFEAVVAAAALSPAESALFD